MFEYDELSFSEKEEYIRNNSNYLYTSSALERIQNDPNLTDSQKEQLINHTRIYGE